MKENFEEKEKTTEVAKSESVDSKGTLEASNDSLAQLVAIGKKQLFLQRISTMCFLGMLLVVVVCALVIVPKAVTTLSHINTVATKAEKSLENVDSMTTSVSTTAGNMDKLLNDNGEKLTSAVKSISEIDFEGLNKAITDLQSAVGPLAKLFGGKTN